MTLSSLPSKHPPSTPRFGPSNVSPLWGPNFPGPRRRLECPRVCSQACSLVAEGNDFNGFGLQFTPTICRVFFMDAPSSSHTSPALDGVLVDPSSRMGAKLSWFIPLSNINAIQSTHGLVFLIQLKYNVVLEDQYGWANKGSQ
ncbi:hypothetical protein DSO57_1038010 [Entomophthora muscae]|uniref:Uncharacterized protein n=1 Tax=Entomophthora muscae TaxID=34485 RepID=A0ACC2TXE2_9FUNG|nr:hypothetical protein DSO57_1038010 [Entomophthora muscae]